jgi:hypothetical protein
MQISLELFDGWNLILMPPRAGEVHCLISLPGITEKSFQPHPPGNLTF